MSRPRSTVTHLECSRCGERHDDRRPQTVCRACARVLVARYDLETARRTFDRGALAGRERSVWRYREVLPLRAPAAEVTLGEGMTPLLATPRLGAALGLDRLWVKDEGRNPTGSFKARGLAVAVAKAKELGLRELALPTAGNAGGAAAAYGARAGLAVHVAMPEDAPRAMIDEVAAMGADLELVAGLISDAGKRIAAGCREHGWFDLATLKEPYRLEGKKTMGYELWEQMNGELPDVILYPTGGGTGLVGMWKAFSELECMALAGARRPRMIVVQAAGCAPIVRAVETGAARAEPWLDAATLAPGIRVPAPYGDDLILEAVRASDGTAIAVEDREILDGARELTAREGIDACPEGGACVAALRRLVAAGAVERRERVVVWNTGSGLKHPELRAGVLGSRSRSG